MAQRELVERKRWLTREQFVELLSVGQVLPGPNVVNLSMMIGDRFFGLRGAMSALAGMLAMPLVIVLLLASLYSRYAHHPAVQGALRGMGAVAAGLILGTAVKLVVALKGNAMGRVVCGALIALAFAGIALLRLPLVAVLLVLGTGASAWAFRQLGRQAPAVSNAGLSAPPQGPAP